VIADARVPVHRGTADYERQLGDLQNWENWEIALATGDGSDEPSRAMASDAL
jgi:hypothetical protein